MNNAICYFFGHFTEALILYLYASSLFLPADDNSPQAFACSSERHSRQTKKAILVLSFLYTALFGISLLEIRMLNAVFSLAVTFLYLFTQYDLKWHAALFHSAILTAVMAICEVLLLGIISFSSPYFFADAEYSQNLIMLTIFGKTLNFAIIYALIWIMKGKQKTNASHQDISAFLQGLFPLISIFIMLTFIKMEENAAFPRTLSWMVTLSAMLLLGLNLLVFGLAHYNQRKYIQYIEMQLLLQKESDLAKYYKMLLAQYDNQGILVHDMKKHLQSIDLLNQQHETEKISAYVKQLLCSAELKDISRLCDHELFNAILFRYQKQCLSMHIAFHADVRSGTVHFMEERDITALFCNLLDNAVEASADIPESFIELTIQKREKTPYVVVTVINSCRHNPFSDKQAFLTQHLRTCKADFKKHGFGIKSIQKTAAKYDGYVQMYYEERSYTFHNIITLKSERF